MEIYQTTTFEGSSASINLDALYDLKSSFSCVSPETARRLGVVDKISDPFMLHTQKNGHYIDVTESIFLSFYVDDVKLTDEFYLIPGLTDDAIVGAYTIRIWRLLLDETNNLVKINPNFPRMLNT